MRRSERCALASIDAKRRRASGVARPAWLALSQAALVLLTCGDAALLYSCAVNGLDDDFLPLPITASVLVGCVLLPHLLGRHVKRARSEGHGAASLVTGIGMAALFVALVAAVTWFRLAGEASLPLAAESAGSGLASIGSSVGASDDGSHVALTALMSVMLVVTAACSFFCASWDDSGREADGKVVALQEVGDAMRGDLVELRFALDGIERLRLADTAAYDAAVREARASYGAIKADIRVRLARSMANPACTSRLQASVPTDVVTE